MKKNPHDDVTPRRRREPPAGMSDLWLLDMVDDPETEPEIEVEDLYRMMSDIMTGKTRPHIDTRKGWEHWRTLEREIAEIKARGGIVDFPAL